MKSKQRLLGVLLTVTLVFIVAGAPLLPRPAQASYEDAAIFYDELGQHGSWVDYDKYGPVWYPNQVEEDWRPYANGRWTPSEKGYLFETNEPWGWATYHYGNWMPTENYGWVWVPGRTWYPNTVAWRNSPENAPVDTSYIGWAPIPPPGYVPPPSYASPPGYYGGGGYPGYGGYSPGGSGLDLLTAPFWIFAQASRFLLGFGQPYAPAYSYSGCGCLAPPSYYQVIYPTTTIIRSWYYPSYYQPAYFGGGMAPGAYSWGPPVRYVSRVTRINYITINNYVKKVHIDRVRGGWPDRVVFNRNPHLRRIVPSENPRTWARPMEVRNVSDAMRHLGNPRAIVQPAGLKPLDRARLPKATVMPARARQVRPDQPMRVRGMELPRRSQQHVTPQMAERMKSLRPPGAQGPVGPGRGPEARGRGQWVTPQGPQKGIVGGPQDQRGRRVGPGEGPGMRRGPVEGFQGPGERGVRRGPIEPPEGAKGVRRGPLTKEGFQEQPGGVRRGPGEGPGVRRGPVTKEGFQGPGERGVRRGPVEPPEGAKGVRRGPVEGFQGPGPQGVRRGPVEAPEGSKGIRRGPSEGFQQQEQQRRQQMQQQQMRQQQEQQRRQQMQQQQVRQQQEQQRRQQVQQQQMRQQQEQQRRQQMQQQQKRRQQQEQQEQKRRQQIRQQQEQSRRQQVRQQQEPRRAQQAQRQKKERPQQHSQSQRAKQPGFGER